MANTKQSSQREHGLTQLSDFLHDGRTVLVAKNSLFPVLETRFCEKHGEYPINKQDESGEVRYFPGGCPKCQKIADSERLLTDCNIAKRFLGCTFENFVADTDLKVSIVAKCREYADKFAEYHEKGGCMLLCGDPGTGKNHLATAVCRQVLDSGYSVLRIKAAEYLDEYWSKGFDQRDGWLKALAKVDLLMIDEIGRSSDAKAAKDAFFRLIDARYENQLPTLMATNLDREGMIEVLGCAAYDRLTQGGSIRLTLNWESYRNQV
ncbi:ATP-binding protein [Nitrosomonas marina]|uniref:DNA replication protein DnaC n=1 Tax=Nitrosomonas marina TaxID=917 RepID=A0A1H8J5U8_9PROT|nr:ATP-binding protein [Nitrosomonas marina]SEN76164.1 DNA replication protein DnaC [Nitrosomonas marina]